jgi:DNA-binding YbaB/EbfC family protein
VQPGQPDMQMILQQAQKMQQQLMAAQAELASAEVIGQAGNGLVQVTTTGAGEVRAVRIDPKVVDPEDVETLQDLIVGAFQDAARAAQELQAEKMGPLAGGLGDAAGGLGLPGLGA